MSLATWTPVTGDVELRLLGHMQLGPDDDAVVLGGRKQRAVLAALALRLGHTVSADELVELIWSSGPQPGQPRRTLQVYVANLRKLLRPHTLDIAAAGLGYRLVAGRSVIDVTTFEDLIAEAADLADADPQRALAVHEQAAALWRGRALSDLAEEFPDLEEPARRLDDLRLTASEQRLGLAVRFGDVDRAVAELATLVDAEPWRERAVANLMIGRYRQGRQAEALAVAAANRARLIDELGLEPSPLLRATEQDVLEQRIDLTPRRAAPPRWQLHSRLPSVLTTFVGRDDDLGRITAATNRSRLLTIVGPGGVGKTRLAVEAARRGSVPAAYVPLVSVDDAGVLGATLDAVDLPTGGAGVAQLAELVAAQLGERPAWLVLDNAEHVVGGVSELVQALLRAAPTLTIVVTSRSPLGIVGEELVDLVPLAGDDARRLFADRAELVAHRLDLADPDVCAAIDQLCAAVDGLPLAIELAANRLRVLQLPEMLDRIADRFAVIGGAMRSDLSPHGTMAATIAWSYERLGTAEQTVLQRLAMFPGGATIVAAEAVCWLPGDEFAVGDVIDLVAGLVDQSLVIADHRVTPTRFRMLATIRQFADERRRAAPSAAEADAAMWAWAVQLLVAGSVGLRSPAQLEWRRGLSAELDNIRAAFDKALQHQRSTAALTIASEVGYLRLTRGENRISAAWLRDAIALPPAGDGSDAVARAIATVTLACHQAADEGIYMPRAEVDAALDDLRRGGTRFELSDMLLNAAVAPVITHHDLDWGMALLKESIEVAADRRQRAVAEGMAAVVHLRRRELAAADELSARAADTLLELGDEVDALQAMRALWSVAWRRGDLDRLRTYAELAAVIEHRHDIGVYSTLGRYWLAALSTLVGAPDALARIDAALARPGVAAVRQAFQALRSMILRRDGAALRAYRELVAVQPIGTTVNGVMSVVGLVERGWCAIALGDVDDATAAFQQAAESPSVVDDAGFRAAALEGSAAVAEIGGDHDDATRLLAEAGTLRRDAPARSNLHAPEVDALRERLNRR